MYIFLNHPPPYSLKIIFPSEKLDMLERSGHFLFGVSLLNLGKLIFWEKVSIKDKKNLLCILTVYNKSF